MNNVSEQLLTTIINLEYLLEGQSGEKFDIKHKLLHLISKNEKATPNYLIELLHMARSNLAICCNSLVKQGLITKHKEPENKKEIYYMITPKGQAEISSKLEKTEESFKKMRTKNKIIKLANELSKLI